MKNKLYLLCAGLLLCITVNARNNGKTQVSFRLAPGVTAEDYQASVIVLKMKSEFRPVCFTNSVNDVRMQNLMQRLGTSSLRKIFPNHEPPVVERNKAGQQLSDLSLIYKMKISKEANLIKSINLVLASGLVEWAEPMYLHKPFFTPNDPGLTFQQSYLNRIKAFQAWDTETGDTNVVIGIVDTGTDWDHPDLVNKIKYNYNDPVNGIDDDGDGYIDNFRGWDIADNDNDPLVTGIGAQAAHGSHVSGCAAAETNNNSGVASTGFNCKFLPVKASQDNDPNTYIISGYEGIVYAADHGCSIINCSWGSAGGGSFGQAAISYATLNKDALVVCAAGNNNSEAAFFPASFDYVLSVASTGSNSDQKSSFSNYGTNIDICAPGSNIYSTYYNDNYNFSSGTSMASPVAAGAAAIVKSHFPSYSAMQVGEQLRVSCDNIYGSNAAYQDKLGRGRINMQMALMTSLPSVRFENVNFTDNQDEAFVIGDTIAMTGNFINYLVPTSTNCIATLSSASAYISILNNSFNIGLLSTFDSINNNNSPFLIKVNNNAPINAKILLKLTVTDGLYNDFQAFEILVNVDYINVTINEVLTSITSTGRVFFNSEGPGEGLGFVYNGEQLTYEGSLMLGVSQSKVSDMVRGDGSTFEHDFTSLNVIQQVNPTVISEFDLTGKFRDNAAASPLPVTVRHNTYAWSTSGDRKYVIVEYIITNSGSSTLNNLYAGIFSDWDIMDYAKNRADEVPSLKMGYAFNTDQNGLYAGIKVLTPGPFMHYAIDNISGGAGGVNMSDGFSKSEKYTTLNTNRAQAGQNGTGNDICDVTGTGPFSLNSGDSVKVAFAILAGDDLQDLTTHAANAQIKYDNLLGIDGNPEVLTSVAVFPNPAKDFILVEVILPVNSKASVSLMNLQGRKVYENQLSLQAGLNTVSIPSANLSNGMYFYEIKIGKKTVSGKIVTGQ